MPSGQWFPTEPPRGYAAGARSVGAVRAAIFLEREMNHTVVVNWSEGGFGCEKTCSYCNWRTSPLLPHGPHDPEDVTLFALGSDKDFVTVSGGADPMWRFGQRVNDLPRTLAAIRRAGKRTRLITGTNLHHVASLQPLLDAVSVSLDARSMVEFHRYRSGWTGIDVECSLVLPPIPQEHVLALLPQYRDLQASLGVRLLLRENLNSVFPVDWSDPALRTGTPRLVYVMKESCMQGRYLCNSPVYGHELMMDVPALLRHLDGDVRVRLIGSFVKHLVAPAVHTEYGDIDMVVASEEALDELCIRFGYGFTEHTMEGRSYQRYFSARPDTMGPQLHAVMLREEDADAFVFNSQFDVDRLYRRSGALVSEGPLASVTDAIRRKVATRMPADESLPLFSAARRFIERRYERKLVARRWRIDG